MLLQVSMCSQRPRGQKPSCLIALLNISILPGDPMFDPMITEKGMLQCEVVAVAGPCSFPCVLPLAGVAQPG